MRQDPRFLVVLKVEEPEGGGRDDDRAGDAKEEPSVFDAPDERHAHEREYDNHRGSEVGLEQDQEHRRAVDDTQVQKALEIVDLAGVHELEDFRGEHDKSELHELGWLEVTDNREVQPGVGAPGAGQRIAVDRDQYEQEQAAAVEEPADQFQEM